MNSTYTSQLTLNSPKFMELNSLMYVCCSAITARKTIVL